MLEACLPVGEIEELVEDFGCRERRQRLLSAAMAVRVLIAAAHVTRKPAARLHVPAAADHRRRHSYLMAEHQILARAHGTGPGHQR